MQSNCTIIIFHRQKYRTDCQHQVEFDVRIITIIIIIIIIIIRDNNFDFLIIINKSILVSGKRENIKKILRVGVYKMIWIFLCAYVFT